MTAFERSRRLRLEIKNNPTGRLLDVLESVKKIHDHTTTRDAWAQIFGCHNSDTSSLLNGLARLISLVGDAKAATLRYAQGDPTIYLAPFSQIELMLSRVNFDQHWGTIKSLVNDKMISGLEFGDHMLSFKFGERSIHEHEIESLLSGLAELLEECLDSELPDELKRFLARSIEGLRSALINYRISGADGIQSEIDRIAGAIFRHKDDVQSAKENPETSVFMDKLFTFIGRINDSVQIVQNVKSVGFSALLMLSQMPQ